MLFTNNKHSNQPTTLNNNGSTTTTTSSTTTTTMAQQQEQQPQQQWLPFYQNREFIQGKLEIEEDIRIKFGKITHELYPETILMLDTVLCEWVRDNYSEMVQLFHKHDYTEYEHTLDLCDCFWQQIQIESPLIEFIVNSGIIENHRVSIYLYCCYEMSVNIDRADQYEEDMLFDVRDDRQMAYCLFKHYHQAGEIIINEFIEIRDSQVLK